ncbi:MAG: endo-1,4-beta-xylanase, partial [Butyrivibrio sp.]|nr:endo-1,4-beta-xylanase [Butyrivibrio sp.]
RYQTFFRILLEAKQSGQADVTCVTFWNLLDEGSWLTGFRRETSYPLLFHGRCEAKEAYYAVLEAVVGRDQIDTWSMDAPEADYQVTGLTGDWIRRWKKPIWEEGEYTYEAAYGFVPNLFAYLHEDEAQHDAMLVVPGGGYCMCCSHEGELPAMEFFHRGMNVFVLSYTTDITMSVPLGRQPLYDISRAVRYLRRHAADCHISGGKLLLCGFSAGAHVCGSLAVHYMDVEDGNPVYGDCSNRPDGVILSYPVITTGTYTHAPSIQALLGENPPEEELEYFSLEEQVTEETPPCLIWQTETDALVPVENSYLFATALRRAHVPFAHYVFPSGFHGLTIANGEYFAGWSGGEYTMEQVMRAVFAVREGKGVRVSDKRREELIQQFSGEEDPVIDLDESLREDVGLWADLAWAWIRRL